MIVYQGLLTLMANLCMVKNIVLKATLCFCLVSLMTMTGLGCEKISSQGAQVVTDTASSTELSTSSTIIKYTLSTSASDQPGINSPSTTAFTDAVDQAIENDDKVGGLVKINREEYGSYPEIILADITRDKKPEAIVMVWSGGTAGVIDVLIYQDREGQPVLLHRFGEGYKMNAYEKNGDLYLVEPGYEDGDSNCCPTFRYTTHYKWNGKKLVEKETVKNRVKEKGD